MRDKISVYSLLIGFIPNSSVYPKQSVVQLQFSFYVHMIQQSLFVYNAVASRNYYLMCCIGRIIRESCISVFITVRIFCISVWVLLCKYQFTGCKDRTSLQSAGFIQPLYGV